MNYSSDIVRELADWLGRMSADARFGKRNVEPPDFEIELVRRTIAEINTLHENSASGGEPGRSRPRI